MLTKQNIDGMVRSWYEKLDVHAPMIELMPMLSERELVMVFPEATLHGMADFEGWYQGVIRIFFDEVHTVKEISSEINGNKALVKVVVQWEASRWKAPAQYSDRIRLDAYQTWDVEWSEKVQAPVITKYTVDDLKYLEGSAKL